MIIDRIRSASVSARNIPSRWIRPAVAGASGLVFGLILMGFLVQESRIDLDSFGGGYSYFNSRSVRQHDAGVDIDPLGACQMYVDASMYLADGYRSGDDFLEGCRAAARKKRP